MTSPNPVDMTTSVSLSHRSTPETKTSKKSVDLRTTKGRALAAKRDRIAWQCIGSRRLGLAIGYHQINDQDIWTGRVVVRHSVRRQFLLTATTYETAVVELLDRAPKARVDFANDRAIIQNPKLTFRDAMITYNTSRGIAAEKGRIANHVPTNLLAKNLLAITEEDMYRFALAAAPNGAVTTLERIVNDVRASLNMAAKNSKGKLSPEWQNLVWRGMQRGTEERLKAAKSIVATPVHRDILDDAGVARLVTQASQIDAEFGLLVRAMTTGQRFSQVIRCRVSDLDAGVLSVPVSHKGDQLRTKRRTHITCLITPETSALLHGAAVGRDGNELLFRIKGKEWDSNSFAGFWRRKMDGAPQAYRIRDWSMIRMLLAGIQPIVVAQAHDTGLSFVETAYASQIKECARSELSALAV